MLIEAAVFAYNESDTIVRALDSLLKNPSVVRVTVLINGCSDDTAEIVARLAKEESRINPVDTGPGDKCNAWNQYVHEIADCESDLHLFMDGDCYCDDDAIEQLSEGLRQNPSAKALAAVPFSGRNRDEYIRLQHRLHWLFGNLYGVSTDQIQRLRESNVRLPIGLKGNDHFITRLMHTAWPDVPKRVPEQVAVCDRAGYRFDSLQPFRPRDMKTYWQRHLPYFLRQRQIPLLNHLPLNQLPFTVDAVNQQILADLRSDPLMKPVAIAVRRKLERMYPNKRAEFFNDKFLPHQISKESPLAGTSAESQAD